MAPAANQNVHYALHDLACVHFWIGLICDVVLILLDWYLSIVIICKNVSILVKSIASIKTYKISVDFSVKNNNFLARYVICHLSTDLNTPHESLPLTAKTPVNL